MDHLEFSLPVLMICRYGVNAKFSCCLMGTIIENRSNQFQMETNKPSMVSVKENEIEKDENARELTLAKEMW